MKKKYCPTGIGCLFFLGMLSLLWACSPTINSQVSHESKTTEDSMKRAYQTESDAPAIPPMDVSAPAVFETASFGLG